jgi:hypothetical protein
MPRKLLTSLSETGYAINVLANPSGLLAQYTYPHSVLELDSVLGHRSCQNTYISKNYTFVNFSPAIVKRIATKICNIGPPFRPSAWNNATRIRDFRLISCLGFLLKFVSILAFQFYFIRINISNTLSRRTLLFNSIFFRICGYFIVKCQFTAPSLS